MDTAAAIAARFTLIPVVPTLEGFENQVPSSARGLNGMSDGSMRQVDNIASALLRELGFTDSGRRIFISHRREDGREAAEQIMDALSRLGFAPFIDRFNIGPGQDVQQEISDAIDDAGLIVFLETPLASNSPWVFYEIQFGMSHTVGIHIVHWAGATQLPSSSHLNRQHVAAKETTQQNGQTVLSNRAIKELTLSVEREYQSASYRRRRSMHDSVIETARRSGRTVTALPRWQLRMAKRSKKDVLVSIVPRMPRPVDLFELSEDIRRIRPRTIGALVHSSRQMQPKATALMKWILRSHRNLRATPSNELEKLRL
jgi:hypothetical protein